MGKLKGTVEELPSVDVIATDRGKGMGGMEASLGRNERLAAQGPIEVLGRAVEAYPLNDAADGCRWSETLGCCCSGGERGFP